MFCWALMVPLYLGLKLDKSEKSLFDGLSETGVWLHRDTGQPCWWDWPLLRITGLSLQFDCVLINITNLKPVKNFICKKVSYFC
jgi:hypothetical protein